MGHANMCGWSVYYILEQCVICVVVNGYFYQTSLINEPKKKTSQFVDMVTSSPQAAPALAHFKDRESRGPLYYIVQRGQDSPGQF